MNIQIVVERKRGCGYRVPGALYLRTDGIGRICGALPIELSVCPVCRQGIKPSRGWTWIDLTALHIECRQSSAGSSSDSSQFGPCPLLRLQDIQGISPPPIIGKTGPKDDIRLSPFEDKKGSDLGNEIESGSVGEQNPVLPLPSGIPLGIDASGTVGESIPDPINQDGGSADKDKGGSVSEISSGLLPDPIDVESALSIDQAGKICPLGLAQFWKWKGNRVFHGVNMEHIDKIVHQFDRCGLLWVGVRFYETPEDFQREASEMGISRRITMVPREFKLGETWVALAHRKAITKSFGPHSPPEFAPGIFHIFKPSRIEYVVREDDPEEKLERLEKRGITLIKVEKEQLEMEAIKT